MTEGRFVSYLRVSTGKQGKSGLGLEAQRETVRAFLNGGAWALLSEFVEVETGTGKAERPKLEEALAYCRIMRAILIVANVSRLTRSPDFMSKLVTAGVEVRFCDLPVIEGPAGKFMLRQMLAVAELEAGMIADRTKKALSAAKARGVRLGNPSNLSRQNEGRTAGRAVRTAIADRHAVDLAPILAELRANNATSLRQIAEALNDRNIPTPRGGAWSAVQVKRILERAV